MRVLYVVSQWGAPTQTFVRREVDAAVASGHEVVVLSLRRSAAVADDDPPIVSPGWRLAADVIRVTCSHPRRVAAVVRRAVKQSHHRTVAANVVAVLLGVAATRRLPCVDWVHAHFAGVAASAADAFAAVRGQRFSVFAHAHDIFDDRDVDRYTGDKLRRAGFVAVESDRIREDVEHRFGCRTVVVRMGVPQAYVVEDPTTRLADPNLVVSVGSLAAKKGHDDLLRALARLDPAVTLAVAGDGAKRADLVRLADELGIADRVTWLGAIPEDEVRSLLDGAAAFCLASRTTPTGDRDGVPNVLIEAMARGVPCVSTAVSGIPDLLDGGRGVVVPPGDPVALADALRTVLGDADACIALARRAHQHVRTQYVTDRNWRELEALMRAAGATADASGTVDERRLKPPLTRHSFIQLRALGRALQSEARQTEAGVTVDLGCGSKPYSGLFRGVVVGVDVLATHGDPDVVARAEDLPLRSGSAAVALSTQQLEHVDDPAAVLAEARRILRPDGTLLLSTHGVWPYHPDPHDYWRWTEEGLCKLVDNAGFTVARVHRQGGPATAAVGLLLYPLAGAQQRSRAIGPAAAAIIAVTNVVTLAADAVLTRVLPRPSASASYLVVATPRPVD